MHFCWQSYSHIGVVFSIRFPFPSSNKKFPKLSCFQYQYEDRVSLKASCSWERIRSPPRRRWCSSCTRRGRGRGRSRSLISTSCAACLQIYRLDTLMFQNEDINIQNSPFICSRDPLDTTNKEVQEIGSIRLQSPIYLKIKLYYQAPWLLCWSWPTELIPN